MVKKAAENNYLFIFLNRNYLNNAIDDLKDPKRILPRSIIISLFICILIYFLTFSSYFTALSAYDILISDATAVSFAERVFRPLLFIIPIGVTMSCVGGKILLFF
jgi:L-type amino acid transporter 8